MKKTEDVVIFGYPVKKHIFELALNPCDER
jgi:hypothetical protein